MIKHKEENLKVSISCLVYNHEPYLRECFDGFMMQKTNFDFEVLVHDDASTDNSASIIREYETKYPDIFKPIYQTENQYSKGVKVSATFNFPRAKGKYIAMCEGDDYWTDPLKLQKQVDFLETHPDYVMCSHRFKLYIQDEGIFSKDWYNEIYSDIEYDLKCLIKGAWYHHPLSVVFRRSAMDLNIYSKYAISMDAVLFFHLLKKGKGMMFNNDWAVYRIHKGGVWSGINYNAKLKNEFKARIGLCKVEKSYEAAFFLRNQFTKDMARKWMLSEWRIMVKTFKIISLHFGVIQTLKLYIKKIILNKKLNY